MHNQIRQIAAVLVAALLALLALTVLHCVPAAGAATATDRPQPTMMVSRADQEVQPAAATADSAMHCPVIGSVLAAGSHESRLLWPVWAPAALSCSCTTCLTTRACAHLRTLLARRPGAASGRSLLHQLCVNRR